jgi:hypothetical protein
VGDRSQELEHSQQALALLELKAQPQRKRQRPLAQRRNKPGPGRLSRGSCGQNYPTTIGANASTCASRFAMLPGSDGPVLASGHESSPRSTRPQGPHRPCAPGNAPTPGFAVAGNLFGAAKAIPAFPLRPLTRLAIKIGPMQLPAAKTTALLTSLQGQIRIDFSPGVGEALDPPDGSGTKSRR